jgi:tripartite-type tricarboxylate transporter receptor subunit TctC
MFISSCWAAEGGVDYPVKPIRLVVGFSAGGGTDLTARIIAQKLSAYLGQPVIVDNRTGASGTIAMARVASSEPDGYTLAIAVAGDTIPSEARKNLSYDLLRDFVPISLAVVAPYILVINPAVNATSVEQLIALAKAQPGKLMFASVGVGSTPHLMGELFSSLAKVSLFHVPFKGAPESSIAVVNGSVQMTFLTFSIAMPLLSTHKLRPLAVTTIKRARLLPSLPTLAESGLQGYDRSGWTGVIAPAGVPRKIVEKLNTGMVSSLNTADTNEVFSKQGLEPLTGTPEEFEAFMRRELKANTELVSRLR